MLTGYWGDRSVAGPAAQEHADRRAVHRQPYTACWWLSGSARGRPHAGCGPATGPAEWEW